MLPTFYCIGAQKAGTTWLYQCLAEHPDVFVPEHKEVNWFRRWQGRPSAHEERGLEPYERLFDRADGQLARGDISPGLLAADCAPVLAEITPEARILVILRDPARRAHSHYYMLAGRHRMPFTFDELLDDPHREDPHQILHDGFYAKHLAPFLERFERVEVMRFEDLTRSPDAFYDEVCAHIGVDPAFRPQVLTERSNVAGSYRARSLYEARVWIAERLSRSGLDGVRLAIKRSGLPRLIERLTRVSRANPPLSTGQRARLIDIYREDIEALGELLGEPFDTWLAP